MRNQLELFWDIDTLGVKSDEPSEVHTNFKNSLVFNGARYEITLPFKSNHPLLADNYVQCKKRLESLESLVKRLGKAPEILTQYDKIIKQQQADGIIELLSDTKELSAPRQTYYMPHREVIRTDTSTSKIRIVYDASSGAKDEISLNHCLLPGPSLTPLIFDILLRFRVYKTALTGDLEKAFHQLEIKPCQRNFLRFLWIDNIYSDNPKILTFIFNRLVFGLVSAPFALNATLREHFISNYQESDPEFVEEVLR